MSHGWTIPSVLSTTAWRGFSVKTKFITLRKNKISTEEPFDCETLEVMLSPRKKTVRTGDSVFPQGSSTGDLVLGVVIRGSRPFKRQGLAEAHYWLLLSQHSFLSHNIIPLLLWCHLPWYIISKAAKIQNCKLHQSFFLHNASSLRYFIIVTERRLIQVLPIMNQWKRTTPFLKLKGIQGKRRKSENSNSIHMMLLPWMSNMTTPSHQQLRHLCKSSIM